MTPLLATQFDPTSGWRLEQPLSGDPFLLVPGVIFEQPATAVSCSTARSSWSPRWLCDHGARSWR